MLQKQANTLRFLSADMVQEANSGHPGAALGLADILTALSYHLKHNPKNPSWLNRDRIVFSGGHISALIYSFLHLSGYDISLNDLKKFRQLHSKTPGHPELITPGIEIATGPLGQGLANAVGFAMAAKKAAKLLGEDLTNRRQSAVKNAEPAYKIVIKPDCKRRADNAGNPCSPFHADFGNIGNGKAAGVKSIIIGSPDIGAKYNQSRNGKPLCNHNVENIILAGVSAANRAKAEHQRVA